VDGEISGLYNTNLYTFCDSKATMFLLVVENFGVQETYMIFLN